MGESTKRRPTFTVVIVTWNNADTIAECLSPLVVDPDIEIVVVDNHSSDDSLTIARAAAPNAVLVQTGANCGFSAGVNAGASYATAEILVLLNPDAVATPASLHELAERIRSGSAEVSAPRIVDREGVPARSTRRTPLVRDQFVVAFFLHRLSRRLDPDDDHGVSRATEPIAVDVVSGACFATSTAGFRALGGLDERFFLYGEEVDYCVRVAATGGIVECDARVEVMHLGAVSAEKSPSGTDFILRESRVRWFAKHRGPRAAQATRLAMVFHAARSAVGGRHKWISLRVMLRPMSRILTPTHPKADPQLVERI